LLTHDNSYDENGEQVNAYQKKVAKIMKIFISNRQILNMNLNTTSIDIYRLFEKFLSHLTFEE